MRLNPGILPDKKAIDDRSPWLFYFNESRKFFQRILHEGQLL